MQDILAPVNVACGMEGIDCLDTSTWILHLQLPSSSIQDVSATYSRLGAMHYRVSRVIQDGPPYRG